MTDVWTKSPRATKSITFHIHKLQYNGLCNAILKFMFGKSSDRLWDFTSPLQTPFCGERLMETLVANRESSCTGPWCTQWGRRHLFWAEEPLDRWPVQKAQNRGCEMLVWLVHLSRTTKMRIWTKSIKYHDIINWKTYITDDYIEY